MRIVRATAWIERMVLTEPYRIACAWVQQVDNVIVRLETENGLHAYGVGCPETRLTGETATTIHQGLDEVLPTLVDQDGLERARIVREIPAGGRSAVPAEGPHRLHAAE